MNVTRLAGYLLLLFAALHLVISLADFAPEYAAAGNIGANAEKYGLQTSDTNLRFKLGLEFTIDVLIVGVLAIAGWWLTTTEVIQIVWIIFIGIYVIISIVVRTSPVLPLSIAKHSPGGAFYGAQIQVPIGADVTFAMQNEQPVRQYVVVTKKQDVRVAQSVTPQGQASDIVVLDLSDKAASTQYMGCTAPLTITGTIAGTGSYAKGNQMWTTTQIRVKGAKSGMPERK